MKSFWLGFLFLPILVFINRLYINNLEDVVTAAGFEIIFILICMMFGAAAYCIFEKDK